jgi:hypothetical protein
MDEWRAFDGMADTSFTGVSWDFVVLRGAEFVPRDAINAGESAAIERPKS